MPFTYLFEKDGTFQEFDCTTTEEAIPTTLTALPSRDPLGKLWTETLGLTDKQARDTLIYPYQLGGHKPRYYQEAVINRAIIAVLQAKRELRPPRILLTLATGTDKMKIAFEQKFCMQDKVTTTGLTQRLKFPQIVRQYNGSSI